MLDNGTIANPGDHLLDALCEQISGMATELDAAEAWPSKQLELCGRYGVFEWFMRREWGGQQWDEVDIVRGYLKLSAACLTTTFIITQRSGACRRIEVCDNELLKKRLLPDLVTGASFATLGISHLTTSRRHLDPPVLRAEETADGFVLNGFSPWVTGASHADHVLTGATLDDGRQILVALPTNLSGVSIPPSAQLVGLSASQTGEVRCNRVEVSHDWLIAGPVENIMSQGVGAKTGGLQTSTLAVGLARAAVDFLNTEAERRDDLCESTNSMNAQCERLTSDLLAIASGQRVCSNEQLRTRANSLVLRSTQAALVAAKGSGYVTSHPAGRWCCEALFFLVWSCPQPVMAANLCELAGIA